MISIISFLSFFCNVAQTAETMLRSIEGCSLCAAVRIRIASRIFDEDSAERIQCLTQKQLFGDLVALLYM